MCICTAIKLTILNGNYHKMVLFPIDFTKHRSSWIFKMMLFTINILNSNRGGRDPWLLDLQLSMQSMPITTKVVCLNPVHGEVY